MGIRGWGGRAGFCWQGYLLNWGGRFTGAEQPHAVPAIAQNKAFVRAESDIFTALLSCEPCTLPHSHAQGAAFFTEEQNSPQPSGLLCAKAALSSLPGFALAPRLVLPCCMRGWTLKWVHPPLP